MSNDQSMIEGLDELEEFNQASADNSMDLLQKYHQSPAMKQSIMRATQTDPATAVKDKALIQDTGIPPEMLDYDREYTEHIAKFKQRYPLASKARPATFKWLTDPYNSSVAINDFEKFDALERELQQAKADREDSYINNKLVDYLRSFEAKIFDTTGISLQGTGILMQTMADEGEIDPNQFMGDITMVDVALPAVNFKLMGQVMDFMLGTEGMGEAVKMGINQELKDFLGFDPIKIDRDTALSLRATGMMSEDLGRNVSEFASLIDIPEHRKGMDTEIAGALGMMANQIALTLIARPVALTQMYGIGAYEQAQRFDEAGVDPRTEQLVKGGVVTALLEKAGIDVLMNRLPPMIQGKVKNWIADVFVAGGAEFTEELLENIAHNALEMTYNEDQELLDVDFRELTVAGGAGAIMRALLRASGSRSFKMNQTREQEQIDRIIDTIKATETNELDPDTTASHIQAVMDEHGLDSDIYISADGLSEVINSLDQSMPVVQEMKAQLEQANEVAGDVVVPAKDVLSHMVKNGQIETLRPHIRLNQDSLTLAELEELNAERRQEVNDILEQGMKESQQRNDAKLIEQDIASQLYETGRMTKREARISSKIMSSRAVRLADELGVTVFEAYEEMGVLVKKGSDRSRNSTKNGVLYSQNFGDTKLTEEMVNSETGKRGSMEIDAQVLWDEEVQTSKNLQSLIRCLDG